MKKTIFIFLFFIFTSSLSAEILVFKNCTSDSVKENRPGMYQSSSGDVFLLQADKIQARAVQQMR